MTSLNLKPTNPNDDVENLPEDPTGNSDQLLRNKLLSAMDDVNAVVLDKPQQVKLAFVCVLTGGHLLIEDLPGTGKTMLARAMAQCLDLSSQRIQFTSDLMPSDILGVSIYNPQSQLFELLRGPIFANIVVADEINRAPPRTQSALLEAMAEGRVSVDRSTLDLPQPFVVMATQNPLDAAGTFLLPAAQKDRFLFCLSMGYPSKQAEMILMRRAGDTSLNIAPRLNGAHILALKGAVDRVLISTGLMGYMYDLVHATRTHDMIQIGLSPRASGAMVEAVKAVAFLAGRSYATPEDVQEVFAPLARHRLEMKHGTSVKDAQDVINAIVLATPVG